MLLDLEAGEPDGEIDCDVCIVGGGAVGLAMSVNLARNGRDVVLLEGGGTSLESRSQDLQRGASLGHPFYNIDVGRYRVLGGTTVFWGGQVLPLGPHAMRPRSWIKSVGWPIEHETLEPYFALGYKLVGLADAEFEDDRVWSRLGISASLDRNIEIAWARNTSIVGYR